MRPFDGAWRQGKSECYLVVREPVEEVELDHLTV
jgi:hypothetical protein